MRHGNLVIVIIEEVFVSIFVCIKIKEFKQTTFLCYPRNLNKYVLKYNCSYLKKYGNIFTLYKFCLKKLWVVNFCVIQGGPCGGGQCGGQGRTAPGWRGFWDQRTRPAGLLAGLRAQNNQPLDADAAADPVEAPGLPPRPWPCQDLAQGGAAALLPHLFQGGRPAAAPMQKRTRHVCKVRSQVNKHFLSIASGAKIFAGAYRTIRIILCLCFHHLVNYYLFLITYFYLYNGNIKNKIEQFIQIISEFSIRG